MRLLPVLDLMNGLVVRGIAGQRQEYRPLASRLVASAAPLAIARAFRTHFGFTDLYLADLDAIVGRPPALPLYDELLADGFRLWVDAGLAAGTPEMLAAAGVQTLVAGLESLPGPDFLRKLLARFSKERVVFSLDLKAGQPLGITQTWKSPDPWAIAAEAVDLGVRRLLALDLAAVGVSQGIATEPLCQRLRAAFPHLEITTGGGVRGPADLQRLRQIGVDNVLVASALHDGRLTADHLQDLDIIRLPSPPANEDWA